MYFHHLHFYVKDAAFWEAWFRHKLGFHPALPPVLSPGAITQAKAPSLEPTILTQGNIEIRLSVPQHAPHVAQYLSQHPPGLADIAFATTQFDAVFATAQQQGAALLAPVSRLPSGQRQCQLQGWAHLRHTLIEVSADWLQGQNPSQKPLQKLTPPSDAAQSDTAQSETLPSNLLSLIDHVVINVPQGELSAAVRWYQTVFGLQFGQSFEINTANSGLRSQVLVHPEGTLQLPINEPSSANSQIQEFLHHNRGAGVQHVALRAQDAVGAIAHFRSQGLQLLDVPLTYYEDLNERSDCPLRDLSAISKQQLLLDWNSSGEQGMLLQTFTRPI
ncbi:MAG: 4-hydroxyphenylpyruvate dioxygenase family protein [Phormidesmis sp.]